MCADDVVLDMSPSALLCGGVPKSHSADAISASALLHTNGHVVVPPASVTATQRRRGSDRSAGTEASSVGNKQQSRRARIGRQLRTGRFWLRLLQPWKWRAHASHKTQPSLDALNGGTIVLPKRKRLSPIKKVFVCSSSCSQTISQLLSPTNGNAKFYATLSPTDTSRATPAAPSTIEDARAPAGNDDKRPLLADNDDNAATAGDAVRTTVVIARASQLEQVHTVKFVQNTASQQDGKAGAYAFIPIYIRSPIRIVLLLVCPS